MKSALPTWLRWLCSGALLLFGCAPANQPPATAAPESPADLSPSAPISSRPEWRERACDYPESREGPQPGLVALYIAATPAEIRAAHVDYRRPGEPPHTGRVSAEERVAESNVSAGLAALSVEGIEGTEVSYLVGSDEAARRGALEVVLEGPEAFRIWRVSPRMVEQLAAVSDPKGFGDRWAATLTQAHQDPPELTDTQKKLAVEMAQQHGGDTDGRTVENFDDDYLGHQYQPALWQGVACELAQLARFAVRTGRELYLTQYLD